MVDEFMDAVFTRWPDVIVQVNVHPLMEPKTGLYHRLLWSFEARPYPTSHPKVHIYLIFLLPNGHIIEAIFHEPFNLAYLVRRVLCGQ